MFKTPFYTFWNYLGVFGPDITADLFVASLLMKSAKAKEYFYRVDQFILEKFPDFHMIKT